MKYVFATGQSNMRGRYQGGPSFSVASRVEVWNNVNPLGTDGTSWVSPTEGSAPFNSDSSTNLALWFCHRMSQELDDDVRLIVVARDSSALDLWFPGTGSMFQECIDVHSASNAPPVDVLLWHQGESGGTNYKTNFLAVREGFNVFGIAEPTTPIILGGLQGVRIGGTNDSYLQQLASENPGEIYYASSLDLDHGGDGLHFAGPDLYTFGYHRYWDEYRKHIGNRPRVTGPAIFGTPRIW